MMPALGAVLVALLAPSAGAPTARHFALIIGNNVGPDDLPRLRYADDDAASLDELLRAAGPTTRVASAGTSSPNGAALVAAGLAPAISGLLGSIIAFLLLFPAPARAAAAEP